MDRNLRIINTTAMYLWKETESLRQWDEDMKQRLKERSQEEKSYYIVKWRTKTRQVHGKRFFNKVCTVRNFRSSRKFKEDDRKKKSAIKK